ncbi:MAG: thioredoxin domain-containing protein [Cyclobacteriaceae bacterium]|nr:thioredoxin domain-containing protein [Cyclobacteriaceae bacterium]
MSNRLIHSTSPYLLQHAHNPVDWFEWGKEALEKAKKEDKPILVSIGYSSCHWCHVMERESFENNDIAGIMNEHFVCIKVDREERPDIDQIYMDAVQAMQQQGGWPLNVFLTPDQNPFYGGTYFPPQNWTQLLTQIYKTFEVKRDQINESSEDLRNHLQRSDLSRFAQEPGLEKFTKESLENMYKVLASRFDATWGGMEKSPKFVMPTLWLFLLRYYKMTGNAEALHMVSFTLKKMNMGGLYDQLGGGFSRYSVDGEWFAPHFEKMLYDNGQLVSLYAEAYSITKDELFRDTVYETVGWLKREMMHSEGGFYSALDADSEGVEGKFYTWTYEELTKALGKDLAAAADYFNAHEEGNWEHGMNILLRPDDLSVPEEIKKIKEKLLSVRATRIRPGLDDKILTGWNAMMIQGLVDAYKAFGDESFLALALKNIGFIEANLMEGDRIFRAFKNKRSETEGFLEDYAFLIQAYISLYQVTFDEQWLKKAEASTQYALKNFYDAEEGYFWFSSVKAEKLIAQKKEIFDNVIPSANSVMARNLFHLGILLDNESWKKMATDMTSRLASLIESEPGYSSNWGILFSQITAKTAEIVIVGKKASEIRKELHKHYLPFALTLGTESSSALPLFEGRGQTDGRTKIYVCRNKVCQLPVETINEALAQL